MEISATLGIVTGSRGDLLGLKLVAYIARIRETRTVREWAEGVRVKRGDVEPRLRVAFWIAQFIGEHDSPDVVQSWFQGLNPELDDRSPARLLRGEVLDEVGLRSWLQRADSSPIRVRCRLSKIS